MRSPYNISLRQARENLGLSGLIIRGGGQFIGLIEPLEGKVVSSRVARSILHWSEGRFRVLKAHGLVEVKRGRNGGVVVADRSLEILSDRLIEQMLMGKVTVEQAAGMRLLLEIDGCRTGTPTVEESVVRRLRELDEEMLTVTDFSEFNRLNDEFHVTIGMMGGNTLQGIILKLLLLFVGRTAELVSPDYRGMHSADEHPRIVEAIAERNAERACQFRSEHIIKAKQRILERQNDFFSRTARESLYNMNNLKQHKISLRQK
jgi:DNA-binding FadR family transcriptional regulator